MEVAFGVLGVLPLAVMVFQGYRKVTNFVSNYKCYDDDMRQILNTVAVHEVLLKENLELFLKDIIPENVRRAMLDNPNSPHWKEDELNARFEKKLGTHSKAVKGAIMNCKLTLDKIDSSQVRSLEELPRWVASGTPVVGQRAVKRRCIRGPESSSKRLLIIVKGLITEVKVHCDELRKYIEDLQSLFKVIKKSRRSKHPHEDPSPPTMSSTERAKARQDVVLIHEVTRRLYRAVSKTLLCQCHSVHLCLDGQAVMPVEDRGVTSKQLQTEKELLPKFTFLLAHEGGPPMIPGSMLVCFQLETSGRAVAAPAAVGSGHGSICAEVAVQGEGYGRYVHDASQGRSSFRLQLAPPPPHTLGGSGGYVSLGEVITTRFRELTAHDRFLIAITLAQSLLYLYSLPWVRDWGIGTIYYFTAQEGDHAAIGRWTPYLVLRPGGRDASDRNRDVYRLGYLLLQLGDLCGGEFQEEVDVSELEMQKVLDRVYRSMGRKYVAFVNKCLTVWGQNRGLNLMLGENLECFLAHVEELRTGAWCLTPPADAIG